MGPAAAYLACYRLRATLRRRAGGYLALAALVGLIGGVALASVTAARRTDSSYPDYLASTNPSGLIIQPNANFTGAETVGQAYGMYEQLLTQMRHLPHVIGLATADAFNAALLTSRGGYGPVLFTQVQLVASGDGMFTRQDRLTIIAGRKAVRPDQVVATSRAAAQLHLRVGSRLRVGIYPSVAPHGLPPFYRKLDLTVSGIGMVSTQVVQDDIDAGRTGFLIGTSALDREFVPCCTNTSYIGLKVAGGYDDAVAGEYLHLTGTSPVFAGGGAQLLQLLELYNTAAIEAEAQSAIHPEAIALGVFGIIAALAALIIGAQAISRQLRASADDAHILRALGAGPAETIADSVLGVLAAVVAGALIAVAVAIGLSPFSLFGPVRQVQPGRGIYLDAAVLGLGALGLVVILGGVALVTGYRTAPHRAAARPQAASRGSAVVRAGLVAGLGASGVTGLRMALEPGRGRTAVPVRSVLAGAVLAILVGAATLTFGASLSNLVSRPALYGWNFDYALYSTDGWGPFPPAAVTPLLRRDKLIAASTGVYFLTVQIDGQTVPGVLSPTRPAVGPEILSGSGLDGPGDVVLGRGTLAALHKQVGDYVTVRLGPVIHGARLKIVGTAALPALGDTLGVHPSLATGAILPTSVVSHAALYEAGPNSGPNAILVRLRTGVSQAAGLRSLQRIAGDYNRLTHSAPIVGQAGPEALELQANVLPVQRPAEIVNYRSMGTMPAILAGGVAAGAVAALGLALVASVRRRRRDLALLKTLGFTRRQLVMTVAWQSTVVAVVGLVIGIPLGIAVGRWLWIAFAHTLSTVPDPVVPASPVALAAVGALALANLVAALPGRSAARTPAALLLRAE
ncbi:MAG TPA: FtsX-like permease family protein [Streptosporangiaceae bacterium]|nr:FtsX-like permease family protein [Streptosporangiaceae bacterium]